MEYRSPSPKFQDIQTKTLQLHAKVEELGSFTTTVITIPLASIGKDAIAASDVLVSTNLTDATASVATISGTNLLLTAGGATTFAAADVMHLVIRLK